VAMVPAVRRDDPSSLIHCVPAKCAVTPNTRGKARGA
jgi:hypothetical protein